MDEPQERAISAAPLRGTALARNATFNFVALSVPLLAAVVAVPILVRSLGPERFGLLGLAWGALEYLSLLDAGLTRATIQAVAVAVTTDTRQTRQIVAVSISIVTGLGLLFGALFALGAPVLAVRFDIPIDIRGEAISLFYVVAISVPVVLLMTSLRGVVEGANRFDLSAATKIPGSLASILIPAAGAQAGLSLPVLLILVLLSRVIICVVLWRAVPRTIEGFRWEWPREWGRLAQLGWFATWMGISSVISPILVYLDRFLLATAAGVAATAYYIAPYEGVSRLLVVPLSLAGALFPALAGMLASGGEDVARAGRVLGSALRQIFLALLPAVALVAVFAPWLLDVWLGAEFAARSAPALRILAVGVLINGLAHVPYSYLQAAGRPDLTAKFHVIELLIHVPLTWMLVTRLGVTGAALAWTSRVGVDALLLTVGSVRHRRARGHTLQWRSAPGIAAATAGIALTAALTLAARSLPAHPGQALMVASGCMALYASFVWIRALKPEERAALQRVIGSRAVAR